MPSQLSTGFLLLLAGLQPCLAVPPNTGTGADNGGNGAGNGQRSGRINIHTTKFGDWEFLKEQGEGDNLGYYTWSARVPLWVPQLTGVPTVALMEEFAKEAYQAIVNTRGRNIMGNGQGDDRDTRIFGPGNSDDFVMSAYSHKGAKYVWISSTPRGKGQATAQGRIVGAQGRRQSISDGDRTRAQANLLKAALLDSATTINPNNRPDRNGQGLNTRISIDVFAEEAAYALFETDREFQTDPYNHSKYPPGSVVGTWHRGSTTSEQLARKGTRASVCTEEDSPPKDNRRCIEATRALGITARFNGQADDESAPEFYGAHPPPPRDSYGYCRRGVTNKGKDGAKGGGKGNGNDACDLPNPSAASTAKGSKATNGPAGNNGAAPTTMKTMRSKPTATGAKSQKPTGTGAKNQKPTASPSAAGKTGGNSKAGGSSKTGGGKTGKNTSTVNSKTGGNSKTGDSKTEGGKTGKNTSSA